MKAILHITDPTGQRVGSSLSLTAEDVKGLVMEAKAKMANPHIKASPSVQNDGKTVYTLWDDAAQPAGDGLVSVVGVMTLDEG
jgi:hypothetical protein